MKSIRVHQFGPPSVMRLEEVSDPEPGPDQVVVRIHAAGVNPVDAYVRAGLYGRQAALPYTPGTDAAGIVEAVGSGVAALKPGDRVYTAGSVTGVYAERAVCRVEQVHALPDAVSFAQGAAVYIPYGTAYRALFQCAESQAGDVVLVHGASGGVGTAAVQLARAAGLTVLGTAGSERGRRLVQEQGAHHVLDHHAADLDAQVMAITDGRGVDIILEMLAHVNLGKDLTMLAPRGRVVVIGSRGRVEIDPRDTMVRDAKIIGMLLFTISDTDAARLHAGVHAGLENRTLQPVIGHELPLHEAPQAHERIMQPGAYGKIVLIP